MRLSNKQLLQFALVLKQCVFKYKCIIKLYNGKIETYDETENNLKACSDCDYYAISYN